jgi:Flp pilus assembly protein TadG
MKLNSKSFQFQALRDQTGQIIPWVAMMMLLMLGIGGLVLDGSRIMLVHRQLQSATDAAALAGARVSPMATTGDRHCHTARVLET